ncbi:MAG: hypothetical protein CSA81_04705 [Acidobacteria bacterium]|nr:MAG: hypothetical protein CSA81_04705 [Acidobacteriota bacterium]
MTQQQNEKQKTQLMDAEFIEKGLWAGIREALIRHKKLGQSVATVVDGKAVLIPADQIVIPDEDETK